MNLIEDSDFCALVFSICVLVVIGRFFVAHDPRLEHLGVRVAAGIGVLYAVVAVFSEGIGAAVDLARIAMRSFGAGALVLGPTWVVLSVGAFVYKQHRRIASSIESRISAERREQERQLKEAEERERLRKRDEERERTRPERERAAREAAEQAARRTQLEAERKEQEARRQADEQRRREDVRYKTRLLYDRYAKELKTSMSQKRFDEYFTTYLSDRYSAEEVERRGAQLQAMLLETVKPPPPSKPRRSLSEIREEFAQRRAEVNESSLDEDAKESLTVELNREEDKTIRGAMQQ